MNRALAGLALAAILALAVFYNLRTHNDPRSPVRPAALTAPPEKAAASAIAVSGQRGAERRISVVGTIRADREAAISPRVPGRVVAVLVHAGDTVRAGQELVRLDIGNTHAQAAGAQAGIDAAEAQYQKAIDGRRARAVELDSQISQAEGGLRTALAKQRQAELALRLNDSSNTSDVERAEAAERQAEAGVRQADAGYRQAADTLKRTEFLYAHGGVARVEVEGARAQTEIAKAQRDSAVAALDQAQAAARPAAQTLPLRQQVSEADLEAARAGVRQAREGVENAHRAKAEALRVAESDIAAAKAQVEQARAGKSQVVSQLGSSVLTAPFAGMVTDLAARAGETAQPGQPLMTIVSVDSVYVDAAVPARYASRVRPGIGATVRLDAAPGPPLRGTVSDVLPISPDGRSVPVRIRFNKVPGSRRPMRGATARVDIDL